MKTKKKKINKVVEEYPLFNYEYKKVIEYSKKLKAIKEQIISEREYERFEQE